MVGSAARMRESSLTAPVFLSIGTLKSTRMKTRFPGRSSCSTDLIMAALQLAADEQRHVHHPVGEAPLVVVPGELLGAEVALGHRGLGGVEDRAGGVAVVVDGDRQLRVVLQDG